MKGFPGSAQRSSEVLLFLSPTLLIQVCLYFIKKSYKWKGRGSVMRWEKLVYMVLKSSLWTQRRKHVRGIFPITKNRETLWEVKASGIGSFHLPLVRSFGKCRELFSSVWDLNITGPRNIWAMVVVRASWALTRTWISILGKGPIRANWEGATRPMLFLLSRWKSQSQ